MIKCVNLTPSAYETKQAHENGTENIIVNVTCDVPIHLKRHVQIY